MQMRSWELKSFSRRFRFNLFFLTVLSFSLGITSYKGGSFHSPRFAATVGFQNKKFYETCLLGCSSSDDCSSDGGAAFQLSGSICGQNREYTLDNLDDNECGNEIKFCGEYVLVVR